MKKKVLVVVLTLLFCMIVPNVVLAGMGLGRDMDNPYPVTGGNIYFQPSSQTVTDCDDKVTEAVIPAEIGGVAVKNIDFSAWYFEAIYEDEDLSSIKLQSVTLPASVTEILPFEKQIPTLQQIKVASGNPNVSSDNNLWLFIDEEDPEYKVATAYIGNRNVTSYTIPSGINCIAEEAFGKYYNLSNLTSITIPDTVYEINETAFKGCNNIKDIYYKGSKSDWDEIWADVDNYKFPMPKEFRSANVHLNAKGGNNNNSTIQTTQSKIKIMLNGSPLAFNEAPYMANGTTMVPMRVIFEALKAEVNYDAATQKITANKDDTVIELVLGQKSAKKNGQAINLDVAAVTRNGNTMVPLRFVAEALNAKVDWDNSSQTVSITLAE